MIRRKMTPDQARVRAKAQIEIMEQVASRNVCSRSCVTNKQYLADWREEATADIAARRATLVDEIACSPDEIDSVLFLHGSA